MGGIMTGEGAPEHGAPGDERAFRAFNAEELLETRQRLYDGSGYKGDDPHGTRATGIAKPPEGSFAQPPNYDDVT